MHVMSGRLAFPSSSALFWLAGSEARQDPVSLLVKGTFTSQISMQAEAFDLLHPISII